MGDNSCTLLTVLVKMRPNRTGRLRGTPKSYNFSKGVENKKVEHSLNNKTTCLRPPSADLGLKKNWRSNFLLLSRIGYKAQFQRSQDVRKNMGYGANWVARVRCSEGNTGLSCIRLYKSKVGQLIENLCLGESFVKHWIVFRWHYFCKGCGKRP